MNVQPLYDRVIIKRVEARTKTSTGLYIPESAKEMPQQGIVLAVGEGRPGPDGYIIEMTLKVDDRVLFGKYSGSEINLDGEPFLIMKEEDVLGIIKGE